MTSFEPLPFRIFEETKVEFEVFFDKFDLRTDGWDDDHFLLLALELFSWTDHDICPIGVPEWINLIKTFATHIKFNTMQVHTLY